MAKQHMPFYIEEGVLPVMDALREREAKRLDVTNISRGDYLARLIKQAEAADPLTTKED